jgi:single-strand DNA-binding protein
LNRCMFVGKIVSDVELQYSGDMPYLRFRLAVRRPRSNKNGQQTDFVPCVAFRSTAEFISKYFKKGDYIYIVASYRADEYQAEDGTRRRSHDFYVDEAGFCTPPPRSEDGRSEDVINGDWADRPAAGPAPADGLSIELPF